MEKHYVGDIATFEDNWILNKLGEVFKLKLGFAIKINPLSKYYSEKLPNKQICRGEYIIEESIYRDEPYRNWIWIGKAELYKTRKPNIFKWNF
jgi:hypothetical protein